MDDIRALCVIIGLVLLSGSSIIVGVIMTVGVVMIVGVRFGRTDSDPDIRNSWNN